MFIGSIVALFLAAILLFAGFLVSVSSLAMAQQQTTTTVPGETTTTSPSLTPPSSSTLTPLPLTPQEQEQLNRLQNVIAATNQNLDETEKQIGGIVYTPRWSEPVWVEPDSAAVLIAYCLPGEFAESGQEILGGSGVGFELEVLESYEVALPQNFTAWMMVIGNEDRQNRYPAAVGVICASDANNVETRVVSPQEQQQINNVISQITQVTSIDQVINIINRNNNATNQNTTGGSGGGGGGTAPPPAGGTTITASVSVNRPIYNGSCPVLLNDAIGFSGTITDNVGNRDVIYRFVISNGTTSRSYPEQTIHFDQPGSQREITLEGVLLDPDPALRGWIAIEILQPVQLQSNRAEFEIHCAPSTGGAPSPSTPPSTPAGATCQGINATHTGTPGNDNNIVGTEGSDVIAGLGGNDVIQGLGGDDSICGNAGDDDIDGGAGHDFMDGGSGIDGMLGGEGEDFMLGGEGDDSLDGGEPATPNADNGDGGAGIDQCINLEAPPTNCEGAASTPPLPGGADTIAPSLSVPVDRVIPTTSATGSELVLYDVSATDNVDGTARLDANNMLRQEDNVGGSVAISCNPPSNTNFRIGNHTVQCSATDAAGNNGTASFIVAVTAPASTTTGGPTTLQAEEESAADDDDEDTTAPTDGGGGEGGGTTEGGGDAETAPTDGGGGEGGGTDGESPSE